MGIYGSKEEEGFDKIAEKPARMNSLANGGKGKRKARPGKKWSCGTRRNGKNKYLRVALVVNEVLSHEVKEYDMMAARAHGLECNVPDAVYRNLWESDMVEENNIKTERLGEELHKDQLALYLLKNATAEMISGWLLVIVKD